MHNNNNNNNNNNDVSRTKQGRRGEVEGDDTSLRREAFPTGYFQNLGLLLCHPCTSKHAPEPLANPVTVLPVS
jgi:hypothetical protein